jgi:hypothetical protein
MLWTKWFWPEKLRESANAQASDAFARNIDKQLLRMIVYVVILEIWLFALFFNVIPLYGLILGGFIITFPFGLQAYFFCKKVCFLNCGEVELTRIEKLEFDWHPFRIPFLPYWTAYYSYKVHDKVYDGSFEIPLWKISRYAERQHILIATDAALGSESVYVTEEEIYQYTLKRSAIHS